jgi:hypothetical protein
MENEKHSRLLIEFLRRKKLEFRVVS